MDFFKRARDSRNIDPSTIGESPIDVSLLRQAALDFRQQHAHFIKLLIASLCLLSVLF
jgi:hypothetical protein